SEGVQEGAPFQHVPVLVAEVVRELSPAFAGSPAGTFVDCTLGGGGHAEALLAALGGATLVGLDRDPEALAAARGRLARFGDRVTLVHRRFGELAAVLEEVGARDVRGILYDLGVSSPHLDRPARGFGFRSGGPLDMRMDPAQALTAADVVNGYSEAALASVLSRWGEERFARRIAGAIARRRTQRPFADTADLADVVKDAIPAATRRTGPHPARRTFQALRIEVNDELGELETTLPQAIEALRPGGRVAVISYHSLEDRLVKRTFADAAAGCRCPRDLPVCVCGARASLRVVTRKPLRPGAEEIEANPRASSAMLRVAERLEPPEVA
ncbi:MAG: rRNA (cytosine1402-N4)-methyltransferase, partial [Actinomycetota bacterium]|nr:rRNA (cytosine1402-N4)-methyltransferase [Actinomycetota bacterium]